MIERTTIDGKSCSVSYIKNDWTPAKSKEEATMIKVTFDRGGVMIAPWTPKK
jgi:hypothetical protein